LTWIDRNASDAGQKGPVLSFEDQINSSRHFQRELNRLGVSSAIDVGGGIAVQYRMAFHGEHFVERYGTTEAQFTPPLADMFAAGVPIGAGTDATRVASFNPWVSLYLAGHRQYIRRSDPLP
jgi:predicted amidohydrolase YtcJ